MEVVKIKIYGKFTDYYDNVVGYDEIGKVWARKTRDIEVNFNMMSLKYSGKLSQAIEKLLYDAYKDLPRVSSIYKRGTSTVIGGDSDDYMAIVGFCGKLYPVIIAGEIGEVKKAFTDFDQYVKYRKKKGKSQVYASDFLGRLPFSEKGFNDWKSRHNNHNNQNDSIFVELNSPIFIIKKRYDKTEIIVNPDFSEYKLQSVFDPWTAYQEIDMYLNNQLAITEDGNLERSQELIRDSKGFDNWSFKQKGPKKRKRK